MDTPAVVRTIERHVINQTRHFASLHPRVPRPCAANKMHRTQSIFSLFSVRHRPLVRAIDQKHNSNLPIGHKFFKTTARLAIGRKNKLPGACHSHFFPGVFWRFLYFFNLYYLPCWYSIRCDRGLCAVFMYFLIAWAVELRFYIAFCNFLWELFIYLLIDQNNKIELRNMKMSSV